MLSEKSKSKYSNYLIFVFFLSFFLIGLKIFKSFGLSIDEPFHRTAGYFWLYVLFKDISPSSNYLIYLKNLLDGMEWSNDFLAGYYQSYGPIFDTLAAILEQAFNIKSDKGAFEFKHLLTFITFFISGIYFFKLINQRFNNKIFSIFLVFIYFSSPRIFSESFYNSKDITFMSFCIFSIFHYFSSFKENGLKHLILFSFFAALATQIRVMGILLILFYISFVFWESLEDRKFFKNNYRKTLIATILFFIFLYIFWPFLWNSPFSKFIEAFITFSNYNWGLDVFYLGNYISTDNLPWHYVIVWMFITTPLIYTIFFLIGFFYILRVFFTNLVSLDKNSNNKLWINDNQKKDFFMIFFFLIPILSVILFSSTLYGGWRHLYFVYPSLIYLVGIGVNYFYFKTKKFISTKVFAVLIFLFILHSSYNLVRFHPYQNIYFNSIIKNNVSKFFEVDYWGLANHEAIEFIISDGKKNNLKTITIRTASFTPLEYSKKILDNVNTPRLIFQGTTHLDPQYIFTNFHYEKNPKYQKKYKIPKNYQEVFSVKRAGILINKVYKKK
tara:strand:- start:4770 stop:6434 length:1665 start_codon:yes stop_codon:yes gene_type:complete